MPAGVWQKKCPLCGHSALEHKGISPETEGRSGSASHDSYRYCHHPVEVKGKPDSFTFCGCVIRSQDYARAGNYHLIRAEAKRPPRSSSEDAE